MTSDPDCDSKVEGKWVQVFVSLPRAMHKASRGPWKGVVSAQKAVQDGDEGELLEGTEENSD